VLPICIWISSYWLRPQAICNEFLSSIIQSVMLDLLAVIMAELIRLITAEIFKAMRAVFIF